MESKAGDRQPTEPIDDRPAETLASVTEGIAQRRCGMRCSGASGSPASLSNLWTALIQGVGAAWADDADDVIRRQGRAGADRADAADHADRNARRHPPTCTIGASSALVPRCGIALVGRDRAARCWRGSASSTPNILLALCFVVGSGMALFGPAWQSSVSEQVPAETLPTAVRAATASATTSRGSFGPAIGGVVASPPPARSRPSPANAVLYLPLDGGAVSLATAPTGRRACRASVSTIAVVVGVCATSPTRHRSASCWSGRWSTGSIIGGSVSAALMPLVARPAARRRANLRHHARAFGMGAVIGALNIGECAKRMSGEAAVLRLRAYRWPAPSPASALSDSAHPDSGRAGAHRRWWYGCWRSRSFSIGVQLSGAALGRRADSLAAFRASIARRHRDGKLGLGTPHRSSPAWRPRCLVSAGLMLISPAARDLAADAAGSAPATEDATEHLPIPRCGCR